MSTAEEADNLYEKKVRDIRTALRQYPAKKINPLLRIPLYLLQSYASTLEIFIHNAFGERYLSWFRSIIGFIAVYFIGVCCPPWNWTPSETLHLPASGILTLLSTFAPFLNHLSLPIPIFTNREVAGINIFPYFLIIYYGIAQWRLLEIFLYNRLNAPPHPRSSGEPYGLWDTLYVLFRKTNFQIDLVKQFCEPLSCFVLGLMMLAVSEGLNSQLRFLAIWLISGSAALFLKAYIENRGRKGLYLDRIANDMDLEALRIQQRHLRPSADAATFTEVK